MLLWLGVLTEFQPPLLADDKPTLNQLNSHTHQPIQVRSRPVIERLAVKVIEPVDLQLSNEGHVYVADQKAKCVFRIDTDATVSQPVENLPDIQRIRLDQVGSLYVLASSEGESTLYQVTSTGRRILLATFPFPSSCFARDSVGTFVVAVRHEGRLVKLSPDGVVNDLANLAAEAVDLTYNAGGQLESLMATGHVLHIDEAGVSSVSGFAPAGSHRMTSLSDGSVLALFENGLHRSQVAYVNREPERPVEFRIAATVPTGTRAVGFDRLGNLCLANPDLRAVTKVTRNFEVPCPHCGKMVPMNLNPDLPVQNGANGAGAEESRSF
jgi:hypothetical protein